MDDLASALGMSKKTIYQHFKDKRELVNAVFMYDLEHDKRACIAAGCASHNAIQQFINIGLAVNTNLKEVNPAVIFDLKKYYPKCWEQFESFTGDFVFVNIKNNLELGIEQGFYRKNINPKVVAMIYISLIKTILENSFLTHKDIPLAAMHQQIIDYHLHAICTPKGIEYLEQNLNI